MKHMIRLFLESAPESFSEDCAREIENQIRRQYGGEEHYIARRPRPSQEQKLAAVTDFCRGVPASYAASNHGICRNTLYRLLSRKAIK